MNAKKAAVERDLEIALNQLLALADNPRATIKELRRLQNRVSELSTSLDQMGGK